MSKYDELLEPEAEHAKGQVGMTNEPWVLGIDFGTSYSVAAARVGSGAAEVIEIDGERRIPSVLVLDDVGSLVAGRAAEDLSAGRGARVVRTAKSRIGDPAPIVLGGHPVTVTSLVARLLGHMYAESVRWAGRAPAEVRLTHPATWGGPRRQQLVDAAAAAGMPNVDLVPEPVAAAIAYADSASVPDGRHVLVYDLGGGTFDTAALQARAHGFVIVGRPTGDARLGGELFDELLANHIGEQLDAATWEQLQLADDPLWQHAAAALRREAKRVKEALSGVDGVDAIVALPTGLLTRRITRAELDALIRPHLAESVELLVETAAGAGLRPADVAAVYLVGGASRTPLVETMVAEAFPGVPLSRRGDPKAVAAIGATHPLATPTRLAQRTSIDLELQRPASTAATTPPLPPPPFMPPTVADVAAARTVVESRPATPLPVRTREADPVPPATPLRNRKRLIGAGAAAASLIIGVGAFALTGGGDSRQAVPSSTPVTVQTVIAGGPSIGIEGSAGTVADGPQPVDSTPRTEPVTSATTPAPETTSAPPTTVDETGATPTFDEVKGALLVRSDFGEGWAETPYAQADSEGCGSASSIPSVHEAHAVFTRGAGTQAVLQVTHGVGSYASVADAETTYDELVDSLEACDGAKQTVQGYEYTAKFAGKQELPDQSGFEGCDAIVLAVNYHSDASPIPDLYQLAAAIRCGSNGMTLSYASNDAKFLDDPAVRNSTLAVALLRLGGLPGTQT